MVDQGATVETDAWAAKQIAVQTEDGAVLIEWAPSWGETPTVELSTEFDTAKTRDETKPVVIVKGGVQINAVMRKDFRPADLPAGTEYVRDGTLQDQEPDEATRPKSPEPVVTVEQEEPDEAPRSKSPEPDKEPDEANHSRTAQTDDEDAEDPVPSHPLAQDDNPLGPPVGSYALHPEVREVAKSLFYKPNNIGGDVTSEFTVQEIRRFFRLAKEMVVKLERDLAAAEKADSQIGPYVGFTLSSCSFQTLSY